MARKIHRLILLFCLLSLALMQASCANPPAAPAATQMAAKPTTTALQATVTPEITSTPPVPTLTRTAMPTPTPEEPVGPVAVENYDSLEFPFKKPPFSHVDFSYGSYLFHDAMPQDFDRYLKQLDMNCFQSEDGYTYYLQKDNVVIQIANNTRNDGSFWLDFFQGMDHTRPGTVTPAEAKKIIGRKTAGIMEVEVPGLTEATGAQLFYLVASDMKNREHWPLKYLVKDGKACQFDTCYDSYAVLDIDSDGEHEFLAVEPGGTSGKFTLNIVAFSFADGSIQRKYSEFMYASPCEPTYRVEDNGDVFLYAAQYRGMQLVITPDTVVLKVFRKPITP